MMPNGHMRSCLAGAGGRLDKSRSWRSRTQRQRRSWPSLSVWFRNEWLPRFPPSWLRKVQLDAHGGSPQMALDATPYWGVTPNWGVAPNEQINNRTPRVHQSASKHCLRVLRTSDPACWFLICLAQPSLDCQLPAPAPTGLCVSVCVVIGAAVAASLVGTTQLHRLLLHMGTLHSRQIDEVDPLSV